MFKQATETMILLSAFYPRSAVCGLHWPLWKLELIKKTLVKGLGELMFVRVEEKGDAEYFQYFNVWFTKYRIFISIT